MQIVAGDMEFVIGGEEFSCRAGQSVFIPQMSWHKFRATAAGDATMLFFNMPGGLENMFIEIADAEAAEHADDNLVLAIGAKYGVDIEIPT